MNGGIIAKVGNMGIGVAVNSSGLGMLNSKYLSAIQEDMLSVIGDKSSGRGLDGKYRFGKLQAQNWRRSPRKQVEMEKRS